VSEVVTNIDMDALDRIGGAIRARFGVGDMPSPDPLPESLSTGMTEGEPTPGDQGAPVPPSGSENPTVDPALPAAGDADAGDGGAADPVGQGSAGGEGAARSLSVDLGNGNVVEVDELSARHLLALASWADSLDRNHAAALKAVGDGEAAVIPVSDFQRFQAWQQSQASRQNVDPFSDAMLEPEQEAELRRLRALEQQLAQQQQQPRPQPVTDINARRDEFVSAANAWREAHGLNEDDAADLLGYAVRSGVVAQFARDARVVAPDGTVLIEADPIDVVNKSLNFALASNPDMQQSLIEQQQREFRQRAESQRDDAVSRKKANASSLAAAPAAATQQLTADPRTMTLNERLQAMAEDIKRLEGRP
jgi:hypothetical protein